jgi:hypothetical protein
MGLLQSMHHWMFAGACLLAGVPLLFCLGAWAGTSPGLRRLFRALGDRFRSLAPSVRAALSALLAVATLHGVPKVPPGSNAPSSGPPPAGMVSGGLPARPARGPSSGPRLTAGQYRAGFALARVATNPSPALASVPSNAVVHAPWARYGVAEDTFWLPATNWSFTLGTNRVGGLHVSSSGTLSFGWPKGSPRARRMPDGSGLDFLAPLQTSLGIVPPAGRFWHAPTASNSLLLAWQDVFAGRDAGLPVTFQAELFPSGDFVYRYDLSRLSATNALPAANWVVGAQHGGGGETFAFGGTGVLVHGLELHWRAFGMLDPDIADHDGDGLSTCDEVMVHGTDPRLPDTDLDGLADPDELALGTGPRNPDADGDGLPDGIDPEPFAWNDPDADADGDGCPLWQELLHGTSDAVPGDVARLLADGFRTVVFTVAGTPGPGTVLALGGRPLLLEGREEFSLDLPDGSSIPLALGNAPGVSVSAASTGCIVLAGRTGGLAPGGKGAGAATLVLPAVTVGSGGIVCLHDAHQPIVASVTDGLPGTYNWEWINGAIYGGRSPVISPSWILPGRLTVRFLPDDGNGVGCGTSAMVEQCHRFYCDHGRPARECGICTGGSPEEWCSLHGEWKCVCACLTLGGGGMLAPGGEAGFMLGSENDGCMRHIHHARCCACPGHMALGGWWAEKKTNVVRRISARLDVRRDGVPVAAGDRFAGPAPLTAGGLVPSTAFGDAQVVASHELHPSHTATSSWTVAAIGLDAAGTAGGHCRIRGGTGCVSRVRVLTESALAEGSLRLAASAGLRFSVVEGAPWAAARSALTNTPPASVAASRDFWLSAQVGGDYELGYKLLDPAQRVRLSTNLLVEAIVARLATNAYYTACGSTAGITVNLAPSSHDPEGYTLSLDGTPIADGQPPWPVSVSNLAAGAHSLTVQSRTFPDLADEATLYVISATFIKMWETNNKANQIFNPARKDDPTYGNPDPDSNGDTYGVPRNYVYMVPPGDTDIYYATIKADIQPAGLRTRFYAAGYVGGEIILGSGKIPFDANGECGLNFRHPGASPGVEDFTIRVGFDWNNSGGLDGGDLLLPCVVKNTTTDEVIGDPMVRGSSVNRYASAKGSIDAIIDGDWTSPGWATSLVLPHAKRLLQIFRDGNAVGVPADKQPTSSTNVSFNAFAGCFAEWLTHNSGASFDDGGNATLTEYTWNKDTSLADLVATAPQVENVLTAFYNSTVSPIVTNYFAVCRLDQKPTSLRLPHSSMLRTQAKARRGSRHTR